MKKPPCAFDPGPTHLRHHSDDRVTVYVGRPEPLILCGYHASPAWLPTVLAQTKEET